MKNSLSKIGIVNIRIRWEGLCQREIFSIMRDFMIIPHLILVVKK